MLPAMAAIILAVMIGSGPSSMGKFYGFNSRIMAYLQIQKEKSKLSAISTADLGSNGAKIYFLAL